ncbi:MAG: sugar-binding transcriptional regulator [Chloroflexi bacterium]|nr:sugar-binding transcriptional regulator [Chloroflexota bacterium]
MSDQEELLVHVARYYYAQHLTQAEIGRRINASRSTVSRLLQQALDSGIIKITINYAWERAQELEQQLIARFHLRDARVLIGKGRDEEEIRKGMGVLAARVIDSHVKDGTVFGISYGRSLASTIAALHPTRKIAMTVVPIIGALGSDKPLIDGPELVRQIAQIYGGEYRYLPVPLLVEDTRTRDALIQSAQIYDILTLARKANVALLGIGALGPDVSSLIWSGYLNERELARLKDQGAIGHMCGQFFDQDGQPLDVELNRRAIGIGIKTLQNIETVIAVAGSAAKAEAILGALRGRYLNVLVTDDNAARRVLELAEPTARNKPE